MSDLLDAREVARRLGVRVGWVYEHPAELGALRLPGSSTRPRLRFDWARVLEALEPPLPRAAPPGESPSPRAVPSRPRGRAGGRTWEPVQGPRVTRAAMDRKDVS